MLAFARRIYSSAGERPGAVSRCILRLRPQIGKFPTDSMELGRQRQREPASARRLLRTDTKNFFGLAFGIHAAGNRWTSLSIMQVRIGGAGPERGTARATGMTGQA